MAVYNHKSYHCWKCGSSGDIINFVSDLEQVDFFAAVEKIAEELNIDVKRDPGYEKRKTVIEENKKKAFDYKHNVKAVNAYLKEKRGLTDDTIADFFLGADEYGSVTIPLIDDNSRFVGFAYRRFEKEPKYINSKNNEVFEKSSFFFNMNAAKKRLENVLYAVEGYFCAMSLHQDNKAAIAYNSITMTKDHIAKLSKLAETHPNVTVVIIPDNDGKAYKMVKKERDWINRFAPEVTFCVAILPDGIKDVNDLYMAGHKVEELPVESIDLFVLKQILLSCASTDAERNVTAGYAKTVRSPLVLEDISEYLSVRWSMDKKVVRDFLNISKTTDKLDEHFKGAEECFKETLELLQATPIQFGFPSIDAAIRGGGRKKDVTFIGGYSSVGKTFLTVQMCVDLVVRQHKNVLFFSLEMSAGALYERIIACMLGKDSYTVEKMILQGDPFVYALLEKLKERLFIIDENDMTCEEIEKHIKYANAKIFRDNPVDVVLIDYIQYMKDCQEFSALAATAKGMKPIAKRNNLHLIVLSQFNRGTKSWERPDMSALKGGGDLEASADIIFLLWRPGNDPAMVPEERKLCKNDIMLAIAKARRGCSMDEMKLLLDSKTSNIRESAL